MRQKIAIIVTVVLLLGVLIVINAASYTSEVDQPDTEIAPNRSTYHSGPTGTRALYEFLSESGYPVMRWREVPAQLLASTQKVQTFVIIGNTPRSIDEGDSDSLLLWVERGGTLVIIDRLPDSRLLQASAGWTVRVEFGEFPP